MTIRTNIAGVVLALVSTLAPIALTDVALAPVPWLAEMHTVGGKAVQLAVIPRQNRQDLQEILHRKVRLHHSARLASSIFQPAR